jgi:hypothetical protein
MKLEEKKINLKNEPKDKKKKQLREWELNLT